MIRVILARPSNESVRPRLPAVIFIAATLSAGCGERAQRSTAIEDAPQAVDVPLPEAITIRESHIAVEVTPDSEWIQDGEEVEQDQLIERLRAFGSADLQVVIVAGPTVKVRQVNILQQKILSAIPRASIVIAAKDYYLQQKGDSAAQ